VTQQRFEPDTSQITTRSFMLNSTDSASVLMKTSQSGSTPMSHTVDAPDTEPGRYHLTAYRGDIHITYGMEYAAVKFGLRLCQFHFVV
jgi:hypothetical protein